MEQNFIGERISALLQEHNMSERQLSLELGHASGYINKITSGRTLPSLKELLYICEIFKMTPAEFFAEQYTPEQFSLLNELESLDKEDTQFILTIVQYLKRHNSASRRRKSR